MHDDDDALAGIDLAAWQPPLPPVGTADAVIARMREPAPVSAVDPHERPSRRAWWIGGIAVAAAAVVALAAWDLTRAPRSGHDEVIATHARHLDLDGSTADLDTGALVQWQRDHHRITVHQMRGVARWVIADDDTLVIEPGGPGSTATIEASGASLRVEVQMNLSDMRLLGVSTLTAAAVAMVTVVVYTGHVKATSGGQTVNVTPGATIEFRPDKPPQEPAQPAEPIAVGATAVDVQQLKDKLREANEQVAKLTAAATAAADAQQLEDKLREANEEIAKLTTELAARTASHSPTQPPARRRASPAVPLPPPCDAMEVEDILKQAQNQYANGFAAAALQLVLKTLTCKQDIRMYRTAAMYACAAHDIPIAKLMFEKIPPSSQPPIEQKCQQEGFNLRNP